MMPTRDDGVRFEILGPIRVHIGRTEVAITGRERSLLAVLLWHANELVDVPRMIDAIWQDHPPQNARNQVHVCVSRLRNRLAAAGDSLIVTDRAGYRLQVEPEQLDLTRFRQRLAEARAAATRDRPDEAVVAYRTALAQWRGPALAGLDSSLLRKAATALDEERLQATEERITLELTLGAAGELVAELTELIAQHPYRERLHSALMIALYRAGRQTDALAAYQRVHRLLHDEVGTQPGADLQQLHQRMLNNDPTLLAKPAVEPEPDRATGHNALPRAVDDFTGRPELVAQLLAAAQPGERAPAVLALDGMAGIGKTTLAVHVAHSLVDRFPDAQLFVDLHGHSERKPLEPLAALHTLLRQLGVPAGRIPPELDERVALWRAELAERRALVVLDNAASTAQLTPLLPAGAGCLVLVTSRRRLTGLAAARPLSLEVLTTDEALTLLTQIAGDRVSADRATATEVARRCGNLPLAIRLAGAKLAHRPSWRVRDLANRLREARSLLTELAAEDRTVADALALSYAQLPPELQRAFRLLGLHPGEDFDAYAVAALTGASLPDARCALDNLVDQHLVDEPRPGRYRLHDLVREYAHQLTLATDPESDRHAALEQLFDFYLHTAAETSGFLERRESRRSLRRTKPLRVELVAESIHQGRKWLETERANLVVSVDAAVSIGADDLAWRLARAPWAFYHGCGYPGDLIRTHQAGLAAAERLADSASVATMCNYLASGYDRIGDFKRAAELLRRAQHLRLGAGDRSGAAGTTMNLALVLRRLGETGSALRLYQQSLAEQQRAGDASAMGNTLQNAGLLLCQLGRYPEAARLHRRRLAISREDQDIAGCANPLGGLGTIRVKLGEFGMADRILMMALKLQRLSGNQEVGAVVSNDIGILRRATGKHDEAVDWHRKALAMARNSGDMQGVCAVRNDLGRTLRESGDLAGALEQHELVLADASKIKLKYEWARALDGIAACVRDTDPATAAEHWQRALRMYREMGVPEQAEVEQALADLAR